MPAIYVGYDSRETEAFAVCRRSLRRHAPETPIHPICLQELREVGLYKRPTSIRDGKLWDDISGAGMSTEFAISRFLTPLLAREDGWAIFMDCDVLARHSLDELYEQLDDRKAIMCVKHNHVPCAATKMDGQLQQLYARKNWSSVMAFNCKHKANKALTLKAINEVPGRDLHRFFWLTDEEIGELDPKWNYLVGHTKDVLDPALVHFTEGGPWLPAYRDVEFAKEWLDERKAWMAEGISISHVAKTWNRPRFELDFPDKATRDFLRRKGNGHDVR